MNDRHMIIIILSVLVGCLLYLCWQEPDKPIDKAQQLEFDKANRRAGRHQLLQDIELAQKERKEREEMQGKVE